MVDPALAKSPHGGPYATSDIPNLSEKISAQRRRGFFVTPHFKNQILSTTPLILIKNT
jgi:hypothetical protein